MTKIEEVLDPVSLSLEIFDSFELDEAGQTSFFGIVGLPTVYTYKGKKFKQLEEMLNDSTILDSAIGRPVLVEHADPDEYNKVRNQLIGTIVGYEIVTHKGHRVPRFKMVSLPGVEVKKVYDSGYKWGSPGYFGTHVFDSNTEGADGYVKRRAYFQYVLTKNPRGGKDVDIMFDSFTSEGGNNMTPEEIELISKKIADGIASGLDSAISKLFEGVKKINDSAGETVKESDNIQYFKTRTAKTNLATTLEVAITDSMTMDDINKALSDKLKTLGFESVILDSVDDAGANLLNKLFLRNAAANKTEESTVIDAANKNESESNGSGKIVRKVNFVN